MNFGAKTAPAWKEWEGQTVDTQFALQRLLTSNEHSATFLTERRKGEPKTLTIKIAALEGALAEAQLARWNAACSLSHPHLVKLFETGRSRLGDIPFVYILMEYTEEDLSQVDRPLTEAEAIEMLESASKALAYLHGKNLAHGQLKPSNIVASADQLKISSDSARANREWLRYLDAPDPWSPPEIVEEGPSPAGDVWSLGVVLVEALTGHRPSWEVNAAEPSLPDTLPARFRPLVLHCLGYYPEQRCSVTDILNFLHPEQSTEQKLPARNNSLSPKTSKRGYLLAAAAAVLGIAAVVIVPQLTTHRAETAVLPEIAKQPEPLASVPETVVKESPAKAARQTVVTQVLPDVPAQPRNTIRGKVTIRIGVTTDANGSVVDARNESPKSSRYFGNLALQAARQWKFSPTDPGSTGGSRTWLLRFQFVRDSKRPVSAQAIPAQ